MAFRTAVFGGVEDGGAEFAQARGGGSSSRERALLNALRRFMRRPEGWQVLLFRPSLWPGARPELCRVGHALMEEWASRLAGHVFVLDDGDAFLFSREEGSENRLAAFRRSLEALFPAGVFAIWSLLHDSAQLVAYLASRLTRIPVPRLSPAAVRRPAPLTSVPDPLGLLVQEPVVGLSESEFQLVLRLWRAPRMETEGGSVPVTGGEALLSLFARALNAAAAAETGGRTEGGSLSPAPLLLALTPALVLSPPFSHLLGQARRLGCRLGVLFTLPALLRDPHQGEAAVSLLRERNLSFALAGVSLAHFADLHPSALTPDQLLLEAGEELAECDGRELAALLRPLGAGAVILTGVEDETKLRLGLERGLRLFAGAHAAALAAAGRMLACPAAGRCTLQACRDRAARLSPVLREGCAEPRRLDAAFTVTAPLP